VVATVRRHLATVVGAVLASAALAFCVQALRREWSRVSDALATASWGWLALGLVLAGLAMTVIALRWRACMTAVGADPPPAGTVVRWYYAGELGKYLPGGVWPVVGRGELASAGGLGRTAAYASVGLSLAALYGAAVLPLGLVLLHPRVVETARRSLSRLWRRPLTLQVPDLASIARLLVSYLPAWAAVAGCTLAVARGLDVGGSWWRLVLATLLAWVVGFAAVPVPAGAGVREAVFVATAGIPGGLAAAVAIATRICFVLVDGAGGAYASARLGLTRRRTRRT
jgi:glycosyltransferase 2 family protein